MPVLADVLQCMDPTAKLNFLGQVATMRPNFAFQIIDATLWDVSTMVQKLLFEISLDAFPPKYHQEAVLRLCARCVRLRSADIGESSTAAVSPEFSHALRSMPHLVWIRGELDIVGALDAPKLREVDLTYKFKNKRAKVSLAPTIVNVRGQPQDLSRIESWGNVKRVHIDNSSDIIATRTYDMLARRELAMQLKRQRPTLDTLISEDPLMSAMIDPSALGLPSTVSLTAIAAPRWTLRASDVVSVRLPDNQIFGTQQPERQLCIAEAKRVRLQNVRSLAPLPARCTTLHIIGRLPSLMDALSASSAKTITLVLSDRDDIIRIPGCLPPTLEILSIDFEGTSAAAFEDPQNWLLPRVLTDELVATMRRNAPKLLVVICGKRLHSTRLTDPLVRRVERVDGCDPPLSPFYNP